LGLELLHAPLKLEWMQSSEADVEASRELIEQVIHEKKPDVVHANQFVGGLVQSDRAPVVVTAHSDVLSWRHWTLGGRAEEAPRQWTRYAALVRSGLANASAAVAVSSFLGSEIQRLYGLDRPLRVIHNGWPRPAESGPPLRERAKLSVLAGRAWDDAKNIALAALAAQGSDVGRVVLLGDQRNPETGEVAHFGAPVETLGWVPRQTVDAYLRQARVYVGTARYDPFGLLPVQAALAGCALLLSDIPSYRELWDGAAMFFRSDDAENLRACWQLLADDSLASEIAGRVKLRAEERFTAERMASDYLHLYDRLRRSQSHGASGTPSIRPVLA
jgi:glycosyltransferase involved in cell wall biosynthesis